MKLKDQPISERPRERLRALGPGALSPAELIAILLRTGLKGTNVADIGKQVVAKYGSLHALAQASVEDLEQIKGIGPDKACHCWRLSHWREKWLRSCARIRLCWRHLTR